MKTSNVLTDCFFRTSTNRRSEGNGCVGDAATA